MSTALYRRYRSTRFADLIGQDQIATTLRNQVRGGTVAHGYLFTGIRGTGKTSTARILARAVNCLQPQDGEPCNECAACQEILGGGAVDVLEIDAASNRGIDEIRDLREKVNYLPASLSRKVYIIDEAHMLTAQAWNAFLKTLEEPPQHVVFVLCTTEPHDVPETIRSRVQRFDFRRVGTGDIAEHLGRIAASEEAEVAPDALELLAAAGQGSVRDALSLLDQALATGIRPLDVEAARRALGLADPGTIRALMEAIAQRDAASALRATAAAFDGGADARQLVRELARLARGAALVAVGYAEGTGLSGEDAATCERLAATGAAPWVAALELLNVTERDLRQPVDARLQVEHCLLRLAHGTGTGGESAAVAALAERVARLEAALARGNVSPAPVASSAVTPSAVAPSAAAAQPVPKPAATITPPTEPPTQPDPQPNPITPPGPSPANPPPHPTTPTPSPTPAPTPPMPPATPIPGEPAPPPPPPPQAVASDAPRAAADAAPDAVSDTAPVAVAGAAPGDVTAWTALWPNLVEAVNRRDSMLAGVLRDCRPLEAAPGRLVIGAPYKFHLGNLEDAKKRASLVAAVADTGGGAHDVDVRFCGDDAPAAKPGGQSEVTRAALDAFAGSRLITTRLRDDR